MPHPALANLSSRLRRALEDYEQSLAEIRTSRARPSLLEGIKVIAYEGSPAMRLVELASITSPDPSLLLVKPWDPSTKEVIVKALSEARLGFNASLEGDVIRVPIPPLTEERRKEFTKLVVDKSNQAREVVRSVRRDIMDVLEADKEAGVISEDDYYRIKKEIQEEVDTANESIKERMRQKEEELMTI